MSLREQNCPKLSPLAHWRICIDGHSQTAQDESLCRKDGNSGQSLCRKNGNLGVRARPVQGSIPTLLYCAPPRWPRRQEVGPYLLAGGEFACNGKTNITMAALGSLILSSILTSSRS